MSEQRRSGTVLGSKKLSDDLLMPVLSLGSCNGNVSSNRTRLFRKGHEVFKFKSCKIKATLPLEIGVNLSVNLNRRRFYLVTFLFPEHPSVEAR